MVGQRSRQPVEDQHDADHDDHGRNCERRGRRGQTRFLEAQEGYAKRLSSGGPQERRNGKLVERDQEDEKAA
jgi:hypothetical protein